MRIYSLQTGAPLHIIGMKGTDNGQFLQPIALCFLPMSMGGAGNITKPENISKDEKSVTVPVLVVGDSNNRLQVNIDLYFSLDRDNGIIRPICVYV